MTTLEKTRELFLQGAAKLAKQRPSSASARARPLNPPLETVTRKWGLSASAEQHTYEMTFLNELPPDVAVSPSSAHAAAQAVATRGVSPDGRAVLQSNALCSPHRQLVPRPPSAGSLTNGSPRRIEDAPSAYAANSPSPSPGSPTKSAERSVQLTPQQLAAHWAAVRREMAAEQPGYAPPAADPIAAVANPQESADPVSENLVSIWRSIVDDEQRAALLRKRICSFCGVSKQQAFDIVRQIHEISLGLASRTINMMRLEFATRHKEEDGIILALRAASSSELWTSESEIAWRDVLRLLSK